ncbi:HD-GYP domain-containing protein [Ferrimonas lipolytica]|uniref:HD domain-containing protein n=1 Tax=Ferrimonas lipolytica TaxID=2724191 RepID=A0A6H1UDB4_9GAMM|nr:HD domain-containing phosphohydrolase [Ferrimonas lipolytica]QIZ77075.1 HD domain-containing protein [Ferrimonas lipolytica]
MQESLLTIVSAKLSAPEIFSQAYKEMKHNHPELTRMNIVVCVDELLVSYFLTDELKETNIDDNSTIVPINRNNSRLVPRIIASEINNEHTGELSMTLYERGHRGRFIYPVVIAGEIKGYIFINSSEPQYFSGVNHDNFEVYCDQLSRVILNTCYQRAQITTALNIMLSMGRERDPETNEHLLRMAQYTNVIARKLAKKNNISDDFIYQMTAYAPMHDIGKFKVEDNILFSTKSFTDEERKLMNHHVNYGLDIVNKIRFLFCNEMKSEYCVLSNIICSHHERFDGKGYPNKLKGKNIPLESRIVAIADVFDALLSKRKYKSAWSLSEVKKYMIDNSGLMFDPDCVSALIECIDELSQIHTNLIDPVDVC